MCPDPTPGCSTTSPSRSPKWPQTGAASFGRTKSGSQFAVGFPGAGYHILIKSFDGGKSWTKARRLFHAYDTCNYFDAVLGRCTEDGVAGARDDLGSGPSVDIANGAPTGAGATNAIVDTWVDGRDGLNHEHVMVTYSGKNGRTHRYLCSRTHQTQATRRPCQSLGGQILGGEGLRGLAEPLFEAGARAIVVTHWSIGDRSVLPFVDRFVAGHNLASLEALARLLLEVTERRPVRRQGATVAPA